MLGKECIMNKKLIALLVALAVAPLGQAFAGDDTFIDKSRDFFGFKKNDEDKTQWGKLAFRGVPAAVAIASGSVVTYYAYKNSEKVVAVFKAIFKVDTEELSKYADTDKVLLTAASFLVASGIVLTIGAVWDLINYFRGVGSPEDLLKKMAGIQTKIDDVADKIVKEKVKEAKDKLEVELNDLNKDYNKLVDDFDKKFKDTAKKSEFFKNTKLKVKIGDKEVSVSDRMLAKKK
jgi:hypothetical protein